MAKPYSDDFRQKVMQAIELDGSGGDNRLKRLVDIAIHPLESSKNRRLLTGLLRMNWGASLFSIMIIIREGEGGRGVPRPPS